MESRNNTLLDKTKFNFYVSDASEEDASAASMYPSQAALALTPPPVPLDDIISLATSQQGSNSGNDNNASLSSPGDQGSEELSRLPHPVLSIADSSFFSSLNGQSTLQNRSFTRVPSVANISNTTDVVPAPAGQLVGHVESLPAVPSTSDGMPLPQYASALCTTLINPPLSPSSLPTPPPSSTSTNLIHHHQIADISLTSSAPQSSFHRQAYNSWPVTEDFLSHANALNIQPVSRDPQLHHQHHHHSGRFGGLVAPMSLPNVTGGSAALQSSSTMGTAATNVPPSISYPLVAGNHNIFSAPTTEIPHSSSIESLITDDVATLSHQLSSSHVPLSEQATAPFISNSQPKHNVSLGLPHRLTTIPPFSGTNTSAPLQHQDLQPQSVPPHSASVLRMSKGELDLSNAGEQHILGNAQLSETPPDPQIQRSSVHNLSAVPLSTRAAVRSRSRRAAPIEQQRHQEALPSQVLPAIKYGAMGPALNYILGLDEYGESRPKPFDRTLSQRHHHASPFHQVYRAQQATPQQPSAQEQQQQQQHFVVSTSPLENNAPASSVSRPHEFGAEATSRHRGHLRRSDPPPRPAAQPTAGGPHVSEHSNAPVSALQRGHYRSTANQCAVDFQRILQSLPPTFPLVSSHPYQVTPNNLDSSVSRQVLRPSNKSGSYQEGFPQAPQGVSGSRVVSSPTTPDGENEIGVGFSNRSSTRLRNSLPQTINNRRDEFLWKLFLPQPSVPAVTQPLFPRFESSDVSFPPFEKASFSELSLKALATEDQAAGVSAAALASTPIDETKQKERLLIVVRRLPDKIFAAVRSAASSSSSATNTPPLHTKSTEAGGVNDNTEYSNQQPRVVKLDPHLPPYLGSEESAGRSFNLTLEDAKSVSWMIDRNEFGLDFAQAFPRNLQRIVVADPSINFSNLSSNPEVQRCLRNSLKEHLADCDAIPVFVDEYEAARNERYSEEVLAPLFHYRTPPVSTGFHFLDWTGYQELNVAFLHTVVANYRPGDWILVFNYQLMLLPKMLRENFITRDANIGFYLGTVFPSSEMYRILPQREELLRGILAATFIGFHGFQYKRHFFTACTRVLGVECSGDRIEPNAAVGGGAGARVSTFPRGINPYPWLKELQKPATQARITELREKFKGRKVLLGIDTLDYTKGIPNKMLAFNKFLTDNPEWANKVVFFQICVPKSQGGYQESTGFDQNGRISRVDRREILANLYQLVGAINANFGNVINQPVHFLLSPLSVEQLVCLYALADIVVITPLRESLSWTAYEFVLCQSYTNKGVLILSEFSGSSQSLGAAAICVNPWDPHALASAIHDALVMKDEEKLERHNYAFNYVLNYDSKSWGHHLMMEFRESAAEIEAERRSIPRKLTVTRIAQAKHGTSISILILGLHGALCPATSRGIDPQLAGKARLPKQVEMALHVLASDPKTYILILSSSPVSALAQSVERFENVTLMAENGHFIRIAKNLQQQRDLSNVISSSRDAIVFEGSSVQPEANNTSQPLQNTGIANSTSFPGPPITSTTSSQIDVIDTHHDKPNYTKHHYGRSKTARSPNSTLEPAPSIPFLPAATGLDLSWMEPVEEICRYFEQRTPGSFLYRTATSVAWNYRGAQREHGAIQARDLLIHLWAGPATLTAATDIVVGPHSVEVRSSATSKAQAVEKWINELEELIVNDITNIMVFCAANFLPRDEDVYGVVERAVDAIATGSLEEGWSIDETRDSISCGTGVNVDSLTHAASHQHLHLSTSSSFPPDADGNAAATTAVSVADKILTCTVGLKPSRAEYYLPDEKEFERTLTLLAALTALKQWEDPDGRPGLYSYDGRHLLTSTPDTQKNNLISAPPLTTTVMHRGKSPGISRLGGRSAGPASSSNSWRPQPVTTTTNGEIKNTHGAPVSSGETKAYPVDAAAIIASPELQRAVVAATFFRYSSSLNHQQIAYGGTSQQESQAVLTSANRQHAHMTRAKTAGKGALRSGAGHTGIVVSREEVFSGDTSDVQRRGSAPGLLTCPSDTESYIRIIEDTELDVGEIKSIGAADDEESGGDDDDDDDDAEDEFEADDDDDDDEDDEGIQCDDLSTAETDRTSSSCHQYPPGTQLTTYGGSTTGTFYTPGSTAC